MEHKGLISNTAPCGLHCGKCFAYKYGIIREKSIELKEALGNFAPFAERFASLLNEPVFNNYPQFEEFLTFLTNSSCAGCRTQKCQVYEDCKVRDCSISMGVDFCFQCPKFPCEETGFDDNLKKRWMNGNYKIKELGIEAYYKEICKEPRY